MNQDFDKCKQAISGIVSEERVEPVRRIIELFVLKWDLSPNHSMVSYLYENLQSVCDRLNKKMEEV